MAEENYTDTEMEFLDNKYEGEGPGVESLDNQDVAFLEQKFGLEGPAEEKQVALKKYRDLHAKLQGLQKDEAEGIFSKSGSTAAGALHGLTGGGGDEILAGINATAEVAKGLPGSLGDWGMSYWSHLADAQKAIDQAEKENPWSFGVADTLGEMALGYSAGGAYAATALGAMSGYLRSREGTLKDAATGMAFGAGGHTVGKVVGKTLTGITKKVKSLHANGVKDAFGIADKSTRRLHSKQLGDRGIDEWAESMSNEVVSKVDATGKVIKEPLLKMNQTFEETLQKVSYQRQEYGKKIGNVLQNVDQALGKNLDTGKLYNRFMAKYVIPLADSKDQMTQDLGKKLHSYLQNTFKKETHNVSYNNAERIINTNKSFVDQEPWGLLDVHNLKTDVANYLKSTKGIVKDTSVSSIDHYKKKMLGDFADIINETVESSNLPEASVVQFRQSKTKFADMDNAEMFLKDKIDTMDSGVMGALKTTLQSRGLFVSAAAKTAGMTTLSAGALAVAVNQFLGSTTAPATLAVGLKRLSARLAQHPEKYTSMAERIFARAAISSPALGKALGEADSYFSFEDKPLKRTVEDVVRRKYDVYNMIGMDNPQLAAQLQSAIEGRDKDTVSAIMGSLVGKGLPWVQGGVGWNGKAVTEDDKNVVNSWIKRNPSLSSRRKLQLDFDATSNIPQAFFEADQPIRLPYLLYPNTKERHGNQRNKDY